MRTLVRGAGIAVAAGCLLCFGQLSAAELWIDLLTLPEGVRAGDQCPAVADADKATNAAAWKAEQQASIPLKAGLTLAFTWTGGEGGGDHECLMQVTDTTEAHVDVTLNCAQNGGNTTRTRRICRTDMLTGEFHHPAFVREGPLVITPATAFTLSGAQLHAFKTKGRAHVHWFEMDNEPRTQARPLVVDADSRLYAVGTGTYRMLVNDAPIDLPIIAVSSKQPDRGAASPLLHLQSQVYGGLASDPDAIEAIVLDDERFPLVLDYQVPGRKYRIAYNKISYVAPAALEQKLIVDKRVTVYGIYFEFASDRLRAESTPVLEEIAGVLRKNPDWRLGITGHTDGIGSDAANLELSRKRAAAVKAALVNRYRIVADRLATGGAGASQPQATNQTPEGRARNRRVELTRQ